MALARGTYVTSEAKYRGITGSTSWHLDSGSEMETQPLEEGLGLRLWSQQWVLILWKESRGTASHVRGRYCLWSQNPDSASREGSVDLTFEESSEDLAFGSRSRDLDSGEGSRM